ncbi:hypothetical protein NON00_07040 [Roseomonas sp. GC11]|uniref:hypothetical protein n=1 Tax=Roseomonas sp. GC11 TaxID=2950546 RepID=UPI00210A4A14|nr:hypothetical protein [Roseomonas sp. GC11]MCQ4159679.1 hypothetical protein [Roseomonas sp. GC11]
MSSLSSHTTPPEAPGEGPEQAAARAMAALCGLDPRHFSYPGRVAGREFATSALAAACDIVDAFLPPRAEAGPEEAGPETEPGASDAALLARLRQAYANRVWTPRYRAMNAAFLEGGPRGTLFSPLSGVEVPVIGSVPVLHYQLSPCQEAEGLSFFIAIGPMPVGFFYPAHRLFLVLTEFRLHFPGVLRHLLDALLTRPLAWAEWLRRARTLGLRRALALGDNRPTHFVRQGLAYLDAEETALRAFGAAGGLFVMIRDWCAMDPFVVFPALAQADRLTVASQRVTEAVLLAGLDAHRVYRFTIHPDAAWLRRRLAARLASPAEASSAVPGRLRVMISLDAERQRVVNAVEAFRFVLRRLGEACTARGMALDIVWDGWTVNGEPSPQDQEVMARIEAMAAAILEGLPLPPGERIRVFGRTALDKIADLHRCDLAFTTQGAGALVCSWLLRRPTIVYHRGAAVANHANVDVASIVAVDPRAVGGPPPGDLLAQKHDRFVLAPWGLEAAMRRALAGRLEWPPDPLGEGEPPPGLEAGGA